MTDPLLSVEGLEKHYPVRKRFLGGTAGRVRAVDGVDFAVRRGEVFGLLGESGCGKSTAARSLLRLEEPTAGTVRFDGEDVTGYDAAELRSFRRRAQLVLQNPADSFDPRMTVRESVAEPLRIHGVRDADVRESVVADLLERVGLAADAARRYPRELSGGQKQRAALARALVLNPDLLVADEPVSALDVSIQAQVLALLSDLRTEFDLSVLLITHDMNVVREVCDRVGVMYAGELVEVGPTEALLADPAHPYTRALTEAVPTVGGRAGSRLSGEVGGRAGNRISGEVDGRTGNGVSGEVSGRTGSRRPGEVGGDDEERTGLAGEVDARAGIGHAGEVPDPADPPPGCRFHPRCPSVVPPEGVGLDRGAYRRLLRLYVDVREGTVDRAALAERADADAPADAAAPDADDLRALVRAAYDLPADPHGPEADARRALVEAAAGIARGDRAAGVPAAAEPLRSPCTTDPPAHVSPAEGRRVACHLHAGVGRDDPGDTDGPDGGTSPESTEVSGR